jgi:predicted transposase/invertase (TIGR01784 family)
MSISKFLDPKNDLAFRRIFGSEKNKDILIHFINDVLGLEGSDQIQEVTFQPTIQEPEIAVKKQSAVDVLCKDANGVLIIVEMQVAPQEGFEKRAQYYAAKAYSRQLNKGKLEGARYKDLKEPFLKIKKPIYHAISYWTKKLIPKIYKTFHLPSLSYLNLG